MFIEKKCVESNYPRSLKLSLGAMLATLVLAGGVTAGWAQQNRAGSGRRMQQGGTQISQGQRGSGIISSVFSGQTMRRNSETSLRFCWKGANVPAPSQVFLVLPGGRLEESNIRCQGITRMPQQEACTRQNRELMHVACTLRTPDFFAGTRYVLASGEPGAQPSSFTRFSGTSIEVQP